ncbi:MAG: hypothetical protein ACFFHD_06630 [Promethearchaeota archaeon]
MNFIDIDWPRYFAIFITDNLIISFAVLLSYKLLKRKKNRAIFTLSGYYLFYSIGLLINEIMVPVLLNPIARSLNLVATFIALLSSPLLLFFLLILYYTEQKFHFKYQVLIFLTYAIILILILNYPGGFQYNELTNWRPLYSFELFILLTIFITISTIIPQLIYTIKLHKKVSDSKLKKRLNYFFFGLWIGNLFIYYGGILFNTWSNMVFRVVYSIVIFVVTILAGLLIYFGVGKDI